MKEFFSLNNPLFRFLERVFDLMVVTFLWGVLCLPVITAGASTSAAFYVLQRMVRNEETYIFKNFFRGFRMNFSQATKMWLIFLPIGAFLGFDFYAYFGPLHDRMPVWGIPVLLIISFVYLMIFLYSFCMQSRYKLTIPQIFRNSLILLLLHVKHTLLVGSSVILMVILIALNKYTMIFGLLLGPGVIFYVVCMFMQRIFDPLEQNEAAAEDKPAAPEETASDEDRDVPDSEGK